ncbi:hypothetical protein L9F63_021146 [Diploptera punctata]|uniref:Uncharacterized protein n=1 Tax=Diploptera punctata TaxID=6984 RepID=A0AAD7ZQ80_DIPPU|nr:hypothetical protein L9F63_021146 [Diploptera punctata]
MRTEITSTTSPPNIPLPQLEETLIQALSHAETTLTECILANAEINITYHGTTVIPLDNVDIEIGNLALIYLSNMTLKSSPLHMITVIPHLNLMYLDLIANISFIEVTGTYNISPELMNYTSRELISTDEGTLNLTFHDVEISGTVGLNINESNLYVHSVDLIYKPMSVMLRIKFKDGNGQEQTMEERRHDVRSSIEEPVYKDLEGRLNIILQERLNEILLNVSIGDLLENRNDTEISFRTATNNHIGNLNDFVDTILNALRENITDQVHIPNLEKSFERKLGFIRFRGSFKAEEGWLKSLKTLHRTADVILKTFDNSVEVSAALGLSKMEFGYNRYSAKFLEVGPSGSITSTIGENSVFLRGRVSYVDNNCTVTLQELRVRVLNHIRMSLTGLSPFNWILSKVATSIVNRSKSNIIANIEQTVGEKIQNLLLTFDCSSYFPQPAITNTST